MVVAELDATALGAAVARAELGESLSASEVARAAGLRDAPARTVPHES